MQQVFYIMGVSGSGKSTVGKALAAALHFSFADADDFHPEANIRKMSEGIPLQDEDREGWLAAINQYVRQSLHKGQSLVVACSALKEKYRQMLCQGLLPAQCKWIILHGDAATLQQRLQQRPGHFMPPALLQSQLDTLEIPDYGLHLDIDMDLDNQLAAIRESYL